MRSPTKGTGESVNGRDADTDSAHQLTAVLRGDGKLRRLLVGTILARPWFDAAALFSLRHFFFPASRLLAAADEARGDVGQFAKAVPLPEHYSPGVRLQRLLARLERARAASNAIDEVWERLFFEEASSSECDRIVAESKRIKARHDLNSMRWPLRLLLPLSVPMARLVIATPESFTAGYKEALNNPIAALPLDDVTVSRQLPRPTGVDYWLRFRSPYHRLGDVVTARVHEPIGAINPPTIIFGHGICVDFDHWMGLIDESVNLVKYGFRVIRPEAPWHGRRTPRGYFAGERTISIFPIGIIDSMRAAVAEWAVLARWARSQSAGSLAFGGSSLGAMTAQLAAEQSKPDALFLVTHTADMTAAVVQGALSSLWAHPKDIEALGWTADLVRRYLSCLDAPEACPVDPTRVVSIIGRRDTVLPYRSARNQLDRWAVPEENIFEWNRGHFTVPATMIRFRQPFERLANVMGSSDNIASTTTGWATDASDR